MKKILPLMIVGILVLCGLGAVVVTSDKINVDYKIVNDKEISILSFDELDQSQTEFDTESVIGLLGDENFSAAQSFIPQKNTLTRIQLFIGKPLAATASNPFVLVIRSSLQGGNLATASANPEDIPTDMLEWVEFDFEDIFVNIGDTYYIICYTAEAVDNYYYYGYGVYNQYANGVLKISADGGQLWNDIEGCDMCFKTYGENVVSPKLDIISINGGLGLTVELKNTGEANATNVKCDFVIEGGLIIIPKEKSFTIGNLEVDETVSITMNMFGIGLGINSDKPIITITASSPDANTDELIITAFVIGPFVLLL